MTIKPDSIDYQRVEQKHGPLPASATDAEHAHRYRLAQAAALIRLFGARPPYGHSDATNACSKLADTLERKTG